MTIVAYRKGIMAADTAVWNGDVMCGETKKFARMPSGALVATAGCQSDGEAFKRWADKHDRACKRNSTGATWEGYIPSHDDFEAMIVEYDGSVLFVDSLGLVERAIIADFYAIGAGSEFAIGLMAGGACAENAVMTCIYRHAYCGGSMQVAHLHSPTSNVSHLFRDGAGVHGDETKLAS